MACERVNWSVTNGKLKREGSLSNWIDKISSKCLSSLKHFGLGHLLFRRTAPGSTLFDWLSSDKPNNLIVSYPLLLVSSLRWSYSRRNHRRLPLFTGKKDSIRALSEQHSPSLSPVWDSTRQTKALNHQIKRLDFLSSRSANCAILIGNY